MIHYLFLDQGLNLSEHFQTTFIYCCLVISYTIDDERSLRLQVNGAYFQKLGSKSFAVYLIAVTDADGITWFVKRR